MLPKVYIKDIRNYEESNNKNILRLFDTISVSNITELLNIFYGWKEEDACKWLDECFDNGKSIYNIIDEMRNALLGFEDTENKSNKNIEELDENDGYEDLTQYKYLSDWYLKVGMQLMSLGLSYSEFWSLSTSEMYQVYEAIQQKMVMDFNRDMEKQYLSAGLIGGAVWGKLPNEPPKIELEQNKTDDRDVEINTKYGKMSLADYKSLKALEKLGGGLRDE